MTTEKKPLDQALDLLVYAPFGLFLTVTEEMPKLVDKGRQRLTSQVTMARMMGQMAAPVLQGEAQKAVKGVLDRLAATATRGPATRPRSGAAPHSGNGSGGPAVHRPTEPATRPAPGSARPAKAAAPRSGSGTGTGTMAGPGAGGLAIPGYDTLSAMQVVQRLNGLSRSELEAVRQYETGHRGRKTIIHRAEQLLAEFPS